MASSGKFFYTESAPLAINEINVYDSVVRQGKDPSQDEVQKTWADEDAQLRNQSAATTGSESNLTFMALLGLLIIALVSLSNN